MVELMQTNIYEFSGTLIVCGSCLPNMDKFAFEKIKQISSNIYFVCLEEIHMNMVAHKLASIMRLGKVNKLVFATVDKSPHCVQLHYIRNELEKIMDLSNVELINYVSDKGNLVEVNSETISNSKNLLKLSKNKEAD